jgi:quercetin dioxygenase-like cupin family protein
MTESGKKAEPAGQSRVVRFHDFHWIGVEPRNYKSPGDSWRDVTRHPLIGDDQRTPFHVRYFEVGPGGYTTFERHKHQHVVVPIRGRGEVRLGDRWESVGFGDVVYVAPGEPHQFRAVGDEPFGFLCVVDADRDRPVAL